MSTTLAGATGPIATAAGTNVCSPVPQHVRTDVVGRVVVQQIPSRRQDEGGGPSSGVLTQDDVRDQHVRETRERTVALGAE